MIKRTDNGMNMLDRLHADIEARALAIRGDYTDWPCREGCDTCCRLLADVPSFTEDEWRLLRQGLSALPQERLQRIGRDVAALAGHQSDTIVCPLLDQSAGACLVYQYRPVVCRTYGFYVQRDRGFYCRKIESCVDQGKMDRVVWGNQEAIDGRLRSLGEPRLLTEWFAREGMI